VGPALEAGPRDITNVAQCIDFNYRMRFSSSFLIVVQSRLGLPSVLAIQGIVVGILFSRRDRSDITPHPIYIYIHIYIVGGVTLINSIIKHKKRVKITFF
jgi:hypothetical protein